MSKTVMNVAKGVIAGVAIGTAVGMVVKSGAGKSKSKLAKNASKAFQTMGNVMYSISDLAK